MCIRDRCRSRRGPPGIRRPGFSPHVAPRRFRPRGGRFPSWAGTTWSSSAPGRAGWLPPTSPIPGFGTPYEYAGYLKSNWGIEVLSDYLAIQFAPHPEKPGWWLPTRNQPLVIATDWTARLTDHPISKPSQADRAGFRLSCPLRLVPEDERPAGVQIAGAGLVLLGLYFARRPGVTCPS